MSKYKKYEWLLLLVLVSIVVGSTFDLFVDLGYIQAHPSYRV